MNSSAANASAAVLSRSTGLQARRWSTGRRGGATGCSAYDEQRSGAAPRTSAGTKRPMALSRRSIATVGSLGTVTTPASRSQSTWKHCRGRVQRGVRLLPQRSCSDHGAGVQLGLGRTRAARSRRKNEELSSAQAGGGPAGAGAQRGSRWCRQLCSVGQWPRLLVGIIRLWSTWSRGSEGGWGQWACRRAASTAGTGTATGVHHRRSRRPYVQLGTCCQWRNVLLGFWHGRAARAC